MLTRPCGLGTLDSQNALQGGHSYANRQRALFAMPSHSSFVKQIQYSRGAPAPAKAESLLYSAVKPGFYRIYRYEQSADEVRGAGFDRIQKVVFKASGPKLAPLFDGSEQLIGVTPVPWYTRQTYLPGS
jgi:hypothetical protein